MKHFLTTILAAFALVAGGIAQDATPKDAIQIELAPADSYTTPEGKAKLRLRVKTTAECKLSQTLLSGIRIDAHAGGKKRHSFVDEVKGAMVVFGPGTTIEREIELDMKAVLGGGADMASSVTFKWPDVGGAEAQMPILADQKKIDLDKLDYTKTRAVLVTNFGEIELSFRPDKAPNHVRNFIKLAKQGFYDGTQFHRVMPGFMIQGGCPNTKEGATGRPGTGDPGYKIDAEFNDIKHVRGVLSAARSRDVNSAGCQFFLMHGAAPGLDGKYTAYGKVERGMDVIDAITSIELGMRGRERSVPQEPVHLHKAFVIPVYK